MLGGTNYLITSGRAGKDTRFRGNQSPTKCGTDQHQNVESRLDVQPCGFRNLDRTHVRNKR